MFHNENGGTFWIAKDEFTVPPHLAIYVDSSYDSPNACVKESYKHHSSGFVFWTGGGTLREVNYGLTRQDYKPERLLTSENAELIGINKVLKYVLLLDSQPERLTILCDNQTLVKKLNDIREVYKILGRFPASEYPKAWHKAEYDTYMHLMRSFSSIDLVFQHIKGHADSHFNHIADRLAHLGKSIKSGSEYSEELILRSISNDSASWHNEYLPQVVNGEFFLGVSEASYRTKGGTFRHAFCLYDAKNNIFHQGIFESCVTAQKELYLLGAVSAVDMIYNLLSKGDTITVVVPNDFTANILHAYALDYVVPAGLLQSKTVATLQEHRKSVKRFGRINFLMQGKAPEGEDLAKVYLKEAFSHAEKSLEEYSFYRSLYESSQEPDALENPVSEVAK